jgi:hypothetical protein
MKKLKKLLLVIFIPVLIYGTTILFKDGTNLSVSAKDKINIKFSGFTPGEPMFNLDKMLPGESPEVRTVSVKNEGKNTFQIYVQGVKKGPTQPDPKLENILDLQIKENGNTIYNDKLSKFFSDTSGIKGKHLGNIQKNQTNIYDFQVTFPSDAGNPYQGKSVTFDLIFFDKDGEVKGEHTGPKDDDGGGKDKKDKDNNKLGKEVKKFAEACKSFINKFLKRG